MTDDFDLSAAALRGDSAEVARAFPVLAEKLAAALPSCAEIERRGGVFGRGGKVVAVEVRLGTERFRLEHDGGAAVRATRQREVGGVAIKREELGLAEWLQALTGELEELAGRNAEARAALDALLL